MASPFFGENEAGWTDMSNFVVHFAKDYKGRTAYDNMMGILSAQTIKARNSFGLARENAPDPKSQRAACFSEIPLHKLKRLADKRSRYGIVFRKDIVIHRGANPIMYAYKDHDANAALRQIMDAAKKDAAHPIWRVTPFIDAPGKYPKGTYFFEWEREWRKIGDFTFLADEVEFLIIPEEQHKQAKVFFKNAKDENLGPSYECPFIDPYWTRKKIKPLLPDYVDEASA